MVYRYCLTTIAIPPAKAEFRIGINDLGTFQDKLLWQPSKQGSWELWILLISTVLGKIDDLRKNSKSYSIKRYFFMEKQKILPQFDDPTT